MIHPSYKQVLPGATAAQQQDLTFILEDERTEGRRDKVLNIYLKSKALFAS